MRLPVFPSQGHPRPPVGLVLYLAHFFIRDVPVVRSLRAMIADEAVRALVGSPLPRRARVAEECLRVGRFGEPFAGRHLGALVPCDGAHGVSRDAFRHFGEPRRHELRGMDLELSRDDESRRLLDERDGAAFQVAPDDEVPFPTPWCGTAQSSASADRSDISRPSAQDLPLPRLATSPLWGRRPLLPLLSTFSSLSSWRRAPFGWMRIDQQMASWLARIPSSSGKPAFSQADVRMGDQRSRSFAVT